MKKLFFILAVGLILTLSSCNQKVIRIVNGPNSSPCTMGYQFEVVGIDGDKIVATGERGIFLDNSIHQNGDILLLPQNALVYWH